MRERQWIVESRRADSWDVVYVGSRDVEPNPDPLHYLSRERAEAVAAALNATHRAERRVSLRIAREVRAEQIAAIVRRRPRAGAATPTPEDAHD